MLCEGWLEWTVDSTIIEMWLGLPPRPELSIRVFSGRPKRTVLRTFRWEVLI